ncbi:MAG: GGDEF domain-containing protein [Clostridiales bacterium]|nr:GGDEF domain-containing protein [Clostridiales bacterium]
MQTREKIIKDPVTNMYSFETFSKLSDLIIRSETREDRCAVLLFTVRNHDELLEQYGRIMMRDMLMGFVGKIMIVYDPDHLTCYDGEHTMALFVPVAGSDEALIKLGEKILKCLRNPAYFQFQEEMLLDFSCGISVSEEKTSGFAELYDKATHALWSLDEETDSHIAFA